MKTLAKQLLSLQRHYSAGLIDKAEYDQAVRERSGAMLRQGGRLIKHELPSPVYRERKGVISKARMVTGSQPEMSNKGIGTPSLAGKTRPEYKAAPEVIERDMRIRYDRELVAMGRTSVLVRIVKHSKVLTATLGELAELSTAK